MERLLRPIRLHPAGEPAAQAPARLFAFARARYGARTSCSAAASAARTLEQLLPPRAEELDKWGLGAVTEPSVGVEEKTHPSPSPEERGRK